MTPRTALTIAGSDSGGGAGIEADLRTFAAHQVHGTVALSAITAQNTLGVTAVLAVEAEMVVAQVEAVLSDITVDATKAGMLARPHTIEAVGLLASQGRLPHLVVDPVLVSSSGHSLMESGGVEAYRQSLIPFAEVLTPNLREAALLLDHDVNDFDHLEAMADAGNALRALGATWVVIKGGHFLEGGATSSGAPDLVVGPTGVHVLDGERVATRNDHGTGCSLSSSIAANLASGTDVPTAISSAKAFVARALRGAADWNLGSGHGPIDHLNWSKTPNTP